MSERGASEEEVRETVLHGTAVAAKRGRQAKEHVFAYNDEWHGRHYLERKVRVIFVEEPDRLVVLTVYVYYGKWTNI
jgi:hypothetical protein